MTEPSIMALLPQAIADHFALDPGEITADTAITERDSWNPITHLGLLVHLEQAFGVQLEEEPAIRASTVRELSAAIEQARSRGTS
jgi:acyl carrier protein